MRNILPSAISLAILSVAAMPAYSAAPDWTKVPAVEIAAFYPGTSTIEWIDAGPKHGGARALKKGERCIGCHEDETSDIGALIISGDKNEPNPIKGKVGHIPVSLQTAHDGVNLYMRFTWEQPKGGAAKMDTVNQTKLAVMFAGSGLGRASQTGCWEGCHGDARTMPGEKSPDHTKYVVGANLATGVFYDLMQWTSSGKFHDGHVAESRTMDGGKALVEAKGAMAEGSWTVTFTRKLASDALGDVTLKPGNTYPFGFAIHDDYTHGRFHHVSFDIHLGIDAAGEVVAKKL